MSALHDLEHMSALQDLDSLTLPHARTASRGGLAPAEPIHGRPTVLMGFADAMAAIETAWSLQGAGFRVIAFRRAGQRPPLRHVRGVELYDVPAPEHDARATVRAVEELVRRLGPDALLPLDDGSVWVCHQLGDLDTVVAGPVGPAAELSLDKGLQVGAAFRAGLAVPDTKLLDDPREFGPIDQPVIVKPARAVCEVDGVLTRPTGVVCANSTELERAAAREWHGPVLVQPLIAGVGEGLFGHAGADGVTGWSSHRRVRMINPQGSASSACRSQDVDDELADAAERFLQAVDWRGLFMLEFLRDAAGTAWFMELNGRAWGSMALARRRGFEYPAWTVAAKLDPSFAPPVPDRPPHVTCRNLGLDLVHLLFVARGPQSGAQVNWPRLGDAIRDVLGRQPDGHLYNWTPGQRRVLLADTLGTLGQYARKMRGRR